MVSQRIILNISNAFKILFYNFFQKLKKVELSIKMNHQYKSLQL